VERCAVTGANGFIGSNVVRELLRRGVEVTALVGADLDLENLSGLPIKVREVDVLEPRSVRLALEGASHLVHTAACYAFWSADPELPYRVNVEGTRNVLEAALDAGVEKVVYTSSTATLSPPFRLRGDADAPIDESDVLDVRRFLGPYKTSKAMAEGVALRMAARGLPLVTVHPTTVLGPGDRRPTPTGTIIVHFLEGRMKAYVDLWQNLVDVEDVARGHVLALERGARGERFILGGDNLSMRELVRTLAELTGRRPPRIAIPRAVMRGVAHVNEALSRRTGREPLVPLEAILHAGDSRPVRCDRAREALGYRARPARAVLTRALRWFVAQGHGEPELAARLEDEAAAAGDVTLQAARGG